jgi:hypothetical protein
VHGHATHDCADLWVVHVMVAFHDTGNRAGRTWGSVIEHRDAGYHVILPGNLEWGASIPNPPGRTVMVTNALGIVCWDVKTRGSNGCSGPSGSGTPAGAGFVAAEAPAGALIMRTREGHTWFSVNGRSGVGFKNNEGFYEFDLEIK